MTIQARIFEIFETKQITSNFSKREFIVEYSPNPNYPQYVKFELMQDKCAVLEHFSVGDLVEVHFDLRGKPFTNKNGEKIYHNSLNVWKLDHASKGQNIDYTVNQKLDLPASPPETAAP